MILGTLSVQRKAAVVLAFDKYDPSGRGFV